MRRVQKKLQSGAQKKVPKMYILVGLTGMSILLLSAQVAMIVVELGAILPWWCISKWWVHLWYMMGE
jgi:Flp pilus assembly protein TadB